MRVSKFLGIQPSYSLYIVFSLWNEKNHKSSINKLLFKDCASLRKLDLSNNNILTLSKWELKNVLALEYLDLSFNRVRDLGGLSFEGRNLKTINLRLVFKFMPLSHILIGWKWASIENRKSHNNIDKLQSTVFKYLDDVEEMNLSYNKIPWFSVAFSGKHQRF